MERLDRDKFRLSTGREFSANHGLISIATRDGNFEIGEGYDGQLDEVTGERWAPDGEPDTNWTREERLELAEFMIAQWTAFKDSH